MKKAGLLQRACFRSHRFLKRNSSTILTVIGAVGVVATAVTAIKATPKAIQLLEDAKEEKGEELTKLEVVQVAGPVYIPPLIIGVSTLGCIFGANTLNKRNQAALTSAYALLDNSYKEYRKKVKEICGEEIEMQIRDDIIANKDKYGYENYIPSGDKYLFYEPFRQEYFERTMEEFLYAKYHFNRNFQLRGDTNLNEFYDFLGLPNTDFGDVMGWNCFDLGEFYASVWIDINLRTVKIEDGSEDGLECFCIEIPTPPTTNYMEY